jgi:hypothetical protein
MGPGPAPSPSNRETFTAAGMPADAPILQADGVGIGAPTLPTVTISMNGYPLADMPKDYKAEPQTPDYTEGFSIGYYEGAIETLINIVNGEPEDVAARIKAVVDFVQQSFGIELQ